MSDTIFGVDRIKDDFVKSSSRKKLAEKEAGDFEKGIFNKEPKWHTKRILIISIWILFFVAIAIFIIRVLHFVFPECWCWLTDERLQNIDKFLFSGAFGGILVKYASYIFANKKETE